MLEKDIPDLNIFMMCEKLNNNALSHLPVGYHIRTCRKNELDIWKEFPFDNEEDKKEYYQFMSNYFNDVYSNKDEEFFNRCLFLCEDKTDKPIATCFIWKAYDKINTVHWFKTLKEYEALIEKYYNKTVDEVLEKVKGYFCCKTYTHDL